MRRPPDLSDEEWAEYRHCQEEHDDVMTQLADREAQMEHDLIEAYDEYAFAWDAPGPGEQRSTPHPHPPVAPPAPAPRRSR